MGFINRNSEGRIVLFGDLKAADDPGVFFIGYEDHSTNELFISVFSLFAETFTLDSFKKIKISSKNVWKLGLSIYQFLK